MAKIEVKIEAGRLTADPAPLPAPLQLQVRTMDGDAFWISTDMRATVLSCKLSIQEARGMHACMQKLVCLGRVLADESQLDRYLITDCDFLVLVTAKPRPPALMTTGAPLPSSYPSQLHATGSFGSDEEDEEDDEGEEGEEGEDLHHCDGADERSDLDEGAAARFVEMGFAAHEAEAALRLSWNEPARALQMLRSGGGAARAAARAEARRGWGEGRGAAVLSLEAELRALPAFDALGQVVRVDPQVMLVLNTDVMRFEDQRGGQHCSEASQVRGTLQR